MPKKIEKVRVEVIPHNQQRYPTVGDWLYEKDGTLVIRVSRMTDPRYAMLVALHELVEVLLCNQRGITQKEVDRFDIQFEKDRAAGKHGEDDEPGDHPKAPYRKEHFFATNIEALMAGELGVDWKKYEEAVYSLP